MLEQSNSVHNARQKLNDFASGIDKNQLEGVDFLGRISTVTLVSDARISNAPVIVTRHLRDFNGYDPEISDTRQFDENDAYIVATPNSEFRTGDHVELRANGRIYRAYIVATNYQSEAPDGTLIISPRVAKGLGIQDSDNVSIKLKTPAPQSYRGQTEWGLGSPRNQRRVAEAPSSQPVYDNPQYPAIASPPSSRIDYAPPSGEGTPWMPGDGPVNGAPNTPSGPSNPGGFGTYNMNGS
jgi:hypothetical protein